MSFNTAILYDIENLLKGYSFSQQLVANLSLGEIVAAIRRTEQLGQIAVQRAYANWSDPRLAIMRGEINELGIDPVQVFGFSRDQKKNAADIQLAIDAIDLAHVRPALEVFVIVSGDGGFASLAKKLHEYGKTVIGCAYRNATNKTFHAVCDGFVWITDPEEEERQEKRDVSAPKGELDVTDRRNVRMARNIKRAAKLTLDEVLARTKDVLNWYATDSTSRRDLSNSGIYLSVVQEAVKYAVPGFQAVRFGFAKFSEYMQFASTGTPLCVARPPNSQAVLAFRNKIRPGVEVLPDVKPHDLKTEQGCRTLLGTGSPIFRFPPADELQTVLRWVLERPPNREDLGSIIEALVNELNGSVSSESAKLGILCLVSAEAFQRDPEGVPLSEQRLTLLPDVRRAEQLHRLLYKATSEKLLALTGTVDRAVLQQIIGESAEPNGESEQSGTVKSKEHPPLAHEPRGS